MWQTDTPYKVMKNCYDAYFSLNNLNISIEEKFMLISLIVYVTEKAKEKKPDVNYYQTVYYLAKDLHLPDVFIKGMAIICEDFAKNTKEFSTFGVDQNRVVSTIKEYFNKYLPF